MKNLILFIFLLSLNLANAQVNGTLDLTFNGTGYNLVNILGNDNAQALVINSDSSIIIAGTMGNSGNLNIGVKKIFPDGTIDSNFGSGGAFILDYAGFSDFCYDMAIQSDGKIILVGSASISAANPDFLAMRIYPNGTLDTTFGNLGYTTIAVNTGEDYARSVVIQPDGKIVLAGSSKVPGFSTENGALVRLNTDGSLDTTFGLGGISILSVSLATEKIESITLLPSGDFRAVGKGGTLNSQNMVIFGVLSDGNIDPNFGTNGYIYTTLLEVGYDIKEKFNQLYICGFVSTSGAVYVTDLDGSPLATFGTNANGAVVTNLNQGLQYYAIEVLDNGKIIVGGTTAIAFQVRDNVVTSINDDGTLDQTFGVAGNATINTGGFDDVYDIGIQADGKIVGAGLTSQAGGNDMSVFRLENQIITKLIKTSNDYIGIFPNPMLSDEITILNSENKNYQYQLIDFNGKLIQEGTTNSKITFNSELRQGVYILKLNSNKEELRFKIVK
jgi:uncharacterized delta-60 repeat protein